MENQAEKTPEVARRAAEVVELHLEVRIKAERGQVWKALATETHLWWPKEFYTSPKAKVFRLEPFVGGRAFEDCSNGHGVLWYNIIAVEPEQSLDLVGYLTAPFGGPATTMLHLELEESNGETLLKISDAIIGYASPYSATEKKEGWLAIFQGGLKAYVEQQGS